MTHLSDDDADCDGGAPLRQGGSSDSEPVFDAAAAYGTDSFTEGSLGLLGAVTESLKELPGRKAIILLSTGSYSGAGSCFFRFRRAVDTLVDAASRAAVGIYTVDVRGLVVTSPGADEHINAAPGRHGAIADRVANRIAKKESLIYHSQNVLAYLAAHTGGEFLHNTNDVAGAIRRAADDQNGYYLLAYRPDDTTFADRDGGRAFHELRVRVRRPGLRVRSRAGFIGITDDEAKARPATAGEEISRAIRSPFGADGVRLALAPVFAADDAGAPTVDAMLHFDARDLTFETRTDGARATTIDVALVLLDEYGAVRGSSAKTQTIEIPAALYEKALADGIDFSLAFPVPRAGAYQVRAAVRDTASRRIGSASWAVDVPDLKKNRLAASSLVLGGAAGVNAADTAVRRFRLGTSMQYVVDLYNAKPDRFRYVTKLYRDGALVYEGAPVPVAVPAGTDGKRIQIGREITLARSMKPGAYVLEVAVLDARAGKNDAPLTRWIDFDVE